jgi:hypothetical protein
VELRDLKLDAPPTIKAPARLKFAWERFSAIAKELPPLFKKHWREIALHQDEIQLDPDWERYFALELQGVLHVLTVRDGTRLVGYAFMLVQRHLHYCSTLWAVSDMFWLEPDYRFGWDGVRMFKQVERGMRELGVKVIVLNYKFHFQSDRGRLDRLFHRLGYSPTEIIVSKVIG